MQTKQRNARTEPDRNGNEKEEARARMNTLCFSRLPTSELRSSVTTASSIRAAERNIRRANRKRTKTERKNRENIHKSCTVAEENLQRMTSYIGAVLSCVLQENRIASNRAAQHTAQHSHSRAQWPRAQPRSTRWEIGERRTGRESERERERVARASPSQGKVPRGVVERWGACESRRRKVKQPNASTTAEGALRALRARR